MIITRAMAWVAILSLALVAVSTAWFLYWRGQEIAACLRFQAGFKEGRVDFCEMHSVRVNLNY
jgi:hypothetical protein